MRISLGAYTILCLHSHGGRQHWRMKAAETRFIGAARAVSRNVLWFVDMPTVVENLLLNSYHEGDTERVLRCFFETRVKISSYLL